MSGILFSAHYGSVSILRGDAIARYEYGIVYKAYYSYGSGVLRGEVIAKYEDGIVYKAHYSYGSGVLRGEVIAKYEGESDGAAAATAAMLLGLISSDSIVDSTA